jgi:phosphohistidine phosphatase SixA
MRRVQAPGQVAWFGIDRLDTGFGVGAYAVRVRLILVRHAEAAPGEPDELRPLTRAGRDAARELGERLVGERPDAVLCSPLLRARETAAAIATGGETVVAVGHVPDLPDVVLGLTGESVRFAPGGTFEVEL